MMRRPRLLLGKRNESRMEKALKVTAATERCRALASLAVGILPASFLSFCSSAGVHGVTLRRDFFGERAVRAVFLAIC